MADLSDLAVEALFPLKQRYIKLCGGLEERAKQLAALRVARQIEVDRLKEGLRQALRELDTCNHLVAELQQGLVGDEVFERELQELLEHPHVERVSIDNNRIIIDTSDLQAEPLEDNKSLTEARGLGKYRLVFDVPLGSLTVTNLVPECIVTTATAYDYERIRYDHPHVRAGKFINKQVNVTVARYLAERRPMVAFAYVLEALKTVSPALDGISYKKWLIVAKKGGT